MASRVERVGVLWAILNRHVSAETFGRTGTVVVLEDIRKILNFTLVLLSLSLQGASEVLAVFDASGGAGAVGDSRLKDIDVPTVNEVGVVPVACKEVSY